MQSQERSLTTLIEPVAGDVRVCVTQVRSWQGSMLVVVRIVRRDVVVVAVGKEVAAGVPVTWTALRGATLGAARVAGQVSGVQALHLARLGASPAALRALARNRYTQRSAMRVLAIVGFIICHSVISFHCKNNRSASMQRLRHIRQHLM